MGQFIPNFDKIVVKKVQLSNTSLYQGQVARGYSLRCVGGPFYPLRPQLSREVCLGLVRYLAPKWKEEVRVMG